MTNAYDRVVLAAIAKLTQRQRDIVEHVIVRQGSAEEVATANLVSGERALEWIEEAKHRLEELVTLELQRARIPVEVGSGELEARVRRLFWASEPADKAPSWLRGAVGARVRWAGSFTATQFIADPTWHESEGLFQIYGNHVVTGPDSLLLIGSAKKLGERLTERWLHWLDAEHDILVHVGEIVKGDSSNRGEGLLEKVEMLTTWWHTPPLGQRIERYEGPLLVVQNLGKRGKLLPMYSSIWPSAHAETA